MEISTVIFSFNKTKYHHAIFYIVKIEVINKQWQKKYPRVGKRVLSSWKVGWIQQCMRGKENIVSAVPFAQGVVQQL